VKKRVLFLCTGNSTRSQMAEGLVNHDFGGYLEAFSAGTEPQGLNPLAVETMREIGIDIGGQRSEHLSRYDEERFDYVITLCGDAHEKCPLFFGGVRRLHMGFPDPPRSGVDRDELLARYRRLRDDMRNRLDIFFRQELNLPEQKG